MSTGTKEDESSTGRVWAAGYHNVTALSLLVGGLKSTKRLVFFSNFCAGRDKPRILNRLIREHIFNMSGKSEIYINTNKLNLLAFKIIAVLHNTLLATS
jgi:hypothetical protein